jgi:phosphohistidine phosphatase
MLAAPVSRGRWAEKQLFVLRHAKSSWADPGQADRERPLAKRGRLAVKLLSDHVRHAGIRPSQVLCSPARRTLETLAGVDPGGRVIIEPELYGASCAGVIERLRRLPAEVPSVMVVGHNPAMQMLVLRLARPAELAPAAWPELATSELQQLERKFPTGALATLSLRCIWSELGPGCARLTAYVRPRQLG